MSRSGKSHRFWPNSVQGRSWKANAIDAATGTPALVVEVEPTRRLGTCWLRTLAAGSRVNRDILRLPSWFRSPSMIVAGPRGFGPPLSGGFKIGLCVTLEISRSSCQTVSTLLRLHSWSMQHLHGRPRPQGHRPCRGHSTQLPQRDERVDPVGGQSTGLLILFLERLGTEDRTRSFCQWGKAKASCGRPLFCAHTL